MHSSFDTKGLAKSQLGHRYGDAKCRWQFWQ